MTTPVFERPLDVRFQDIDAAGIAFYARVFDYFHDAYVAFLASRGVLLHQVLADRRWGAPLAHAEADYERPLRFGGAYAVQITALTAGETALTVDYAIVNDKGARHARGKTVHVFIDLSTGRPRALPDEIRAMGGASALASPP